MSKGTKKLDAALAQAVLDSKGVDKDSRNDFNCSDYASAEAVFEAGRFAMATNGLSLKPLRFVEGGTDRRPTLTRVVKLSHDSGQFEILESPPWPIASREDMSDASVVAGMTTRTLRYMIRDLLQLPQKQPEPAEVPSAKRTPLHDRNERPVDTRSIEDWSVGEQAQLDELLDDAEPKEAEKALSYLELGVHPASVAARLVLTVPLREHRDVKPDNEDTDSGAAKAAGDAGDAPAVLGDPEDDPTPCYLAVDRILHPVPEVALVLTEEEQLKSFEFASGSSEAKQSEEVPPCPEKDGAGCGEVQANDTPDELPAARLETDEDGVVPCPSCDGALPCAVSTPCGGNRLVTREQWEARMKRPYVNPDSTRDARTAELDDKPEVPAFIRDDPTARDDGPGLGF